MRAVIRTEDAPHMRRAATTAPNNIRRQDEGHMIVGSRSAVPYDIEVDICRIVQSIKFAGSFSGDWLLRAGIGYLLARLEAAVLHMRCAYRAGHPRSATPWRIVGRSTQMIGGNFVGTLWLR
jgi:hypothetical protein